MEFRMESLKKIYKIWCGKKNHINFDLPRNGHWNDVIHSPFSFAFGMQS